MIGPLCTLLAYLIGSISFGLLAAKRAGVDLRSVGSGNIGATNVGRALGKASGRQVLVLDMLKGLVPTALARWTLDLPWPWVASVGVAAAVGHVLPIWHGFRGGKGAATAGGVLLGALPPVGGAALFTWVLLKKLSRRASVASLGAASAGLLLAWGLYGIGYPLYLAASLWLIVVIRHHENIGRLSRGEEPAG